jgi:hypothetical protein
MKRKLYPKDIVKNNPRADKEPSWGDDEKAEEEEKKRTLYDAANKRTQIADKILEIYRRAPYRGSGGTPYRTTASGNRVAWDEPDQRREDEINDRIQRLMKAKQQLKQAQASRERLKGKKAVPQKAGKPMWEQIILEEDFNKAIQLIRINYYSGKTMRFKDWISTMEKILDEF